MEKKHQEDERSGGWPLGGMWKGVFELVEKLGDLAKKGEELAQSGDFSGTHEGRDIKGVYGVSVRFGLNDKEGVKVEPFGNIQKDESTGASVVREVREPMVDLFDEEEELLIVAEMPGIREEDIELELREDILQFSASRGEKRYRKELLLPQSFPREALSLSCNHGIVEIRCTKRR